MDKGHGRKEIRTIWVRDDLQGYLKFPHAKCAFRLQRYVTDLEGKFLRAEVVYGVTSMAGTDRTAAKRLLKNVRGHWTIENRLHYVRDMSFDEDRSQIRKGMGPQVMASLRNVAISALRVAGARYIAKALRWCGRNLARGLRLLGLA